MAKLKRPPAPANVHDQYREVELGGVNVEINSRSLDSFIQQDSLETRKRYDWKTGKIVNEKANIITSARADQMTLSHKAVASGRNLRKHNEEDEDNICGSSPSFGPCYPRYK